MSASCGISVMDSDKGKGRENWREGTSRRLRVRKSCEEGAFLPPFEGGKEGMG